VLAKISRKNSADGSERPTKSAEVLGGLVRKRDVARAASVSPRCVENWMRAKVIPFVRISRRCVRFDLSRVLAALRKFEVREIR